MQAIGLTIRIEWCWFYNMFWTRFFKYEIAVFGIKPLIARSLLERRFKPIQYLLLLTNVKNIFLRSDKVLLSLVKTYSAVQSGWTKISFKNDEHRAMLNWRNGHFPGTKSIIQVSLTIRRHYGPGKLRLENTKTGILSFNL